ncbi:MAG: CvpA family protein [Proteobacteria bacterium]|uniref:CvpA family protein n=1 Tax=Candidatus Enterousia excrementavium TaxID=2840789 RepID=A0A940DE80_9PROT|nr:CvpA family protein [Candidatus Enterousia excrementavium]
MFDFTILDYIYVGVLVASTVWASVRGGIYELVATLSWVIAALAARFVSPLLDSLLQTCFDLSAPTMSTRVASYFIIIFVVLMVCGFFNQRLREKIQNSIMKVTDRTLGIIFGLIRGIVIMGVVYWGALWYYSDGQPMGDWVAKAKTRPIMQLTAVTLDELFFPRPGSKLLENDMAADKSSSVADYRNMINPAVEGSRKDASDTESVETGYTAEEVSALNNTLLQLEKDAVAEENRARAAAEAAANAAADALPVASDATAAATAEMENAADNVGADVASQYGSEDAPVTSD